eukprot:TRINITY_DN34956_c0_g1_i3.p1 TRINITY_DN34956_c0_g1~~TRINITY_DN34956_c0_g1_i3.p1  ORF type:complete len:527 (+),score=129.32 TRINITY_DN34956_c0_g1_i3:130-1710(+)
MPLRQMASQFFGVGRKPAPATYCVEQNALAQQEARRHYDPELEAWQALQSRQRDLTSEVSQALAAEAAAARKAEQQAEAAGERRETFEQAKEEAEALRREWEEGLDRSIAEENDEIEELQQQVEELQAEVEALRPFSTEPDLEVLHARHEERHNEILAKRASDEMKHSKTCEHLCKEIDHAKTLVEEKASLLEMIDDEMKSTGEAIEAIQQSEAAKAAKAAELMAELKKIEADLRDEHHLRLGDIEPPSLSSSELSFSAASASSDEKKRTLCDKNHKIRTSQPLELSEKGSIQEVWHLEQHLQKLDSEALHLREQLRDLKFRRVPPAPFEWPPSPASHGKGQRMLGSRLSLLAPQSLSASAVSCFSVPSTPASPQGTSFSAPRLLNHVRPGLLHNVPEKSVSSSTDAKAEAKALSLITENRRLEEEVKEFQRAAEDRAKASSARRYQKMSGVEGKPLSVVLSHSRCRLRGVMQKQLRSSQELLQSLRSEIKEAELKLRSEEKLREKREKRLRYLEAEAIFFKNPSA